MRPINNACAVVFLKVATRCIRQHWVTAVFRVQTDCIKSSITFQTPFHLTNMCLLNNNLPCLMNIFLNHFLSLLLFYLSYLFGTDFVLCRIVYRTCTLDNKYVCNNLQKHTCFLSLCTVRRQKYILQPIQNQRKNNIKLLLAQICWSCVIWFQAECTG